MGTRAIKEHAGLRNVLAFAKRQGLAAYQEKGEGAESAENEFG